MEAVTQTKQPKEVSESALEWGMASLAMRGHEQSGDSQLVEFFPGGALVAVIDGLGHGEEAAEAARFAVASLRERPEDGLADLLNRCHERLRRAPRGAVMTLVSYNFSESTMTCGGVGNVEGLLLRVDPRITPSHETLPLRRGVLGGQMPPVQTRVFPMIPGDTMILTTDGIRPGFESGLRAILNRPPQQLADFILAQNKSGADDALALVVRFTGAGPQK